MKNVKCKMSCSGWSFYILHFSFLQPTTYNLQPTCLNNLPHHPPENKSMKRQHGIPVQSAPNTKWPKCGYLFEFILLVYPELEPCFTRQLHFSIQEQPLLLFVCQEHTPKVECISGKQFCRTSP